LLCFIAGGSGLGAAGTIVMLLLQQQIQMQLLGVEHAEIFQKMLLIKDRTWNGNMILVWMVIQEILSVTIVKNCIQQVFISTI
jgi:hypothetical protein